MTKQGAFRNVLSVNSFSGDYRDGRQSGIGCIQRSKRMCASISLFVFLFLSLINVSWGRKVRWNVKILNILRFLTAMAVCYQMIARESLNLLILKVEKRWLSSCLKISVISSLRHMMILPFLSIQPPRGIGYEAWFLPAWQWFRLMLADLGFCIGMMERNVFGIWIRLEGITKLSLTCNLSWWHMALQGIPA